MIGFQDLRGRRVISRSSAAPLGEVSDLTLDLRAGKVAAFHVGKGRKARAVDWARIHGVGADAVVVEDDDALTELGDRLSPLGRPALSDLGNALGDVSDVDFDEETGQLATVTTPAGPVEADRLVVVGPFAVIVSARESAQVPG